MSSLPLNAEEREELRELARLLMPLTGTVYGEGRWEHVDGEDVMVPGPVKYRGIMRLQADSRDSARDTTAGEQPLSTPVYVGALPWQAEGAGFARGDRVVLDPGQNGLGITTVWVTSWQHGYTQLRFLALDHLPS